MSTCGNFIEKAKSSCGISVGFGKMILIYSAKTEVPMASLTATAINEAIEDGTIVGVIKGWHTVAGASVAEKNVERNNGTMKLIRPEILADTFTFDDNLTNNKVIEKLVENGILDCILIDDMGYVFGEKSLKPATVETMKIDFSNKTSNGFQNDLSAEKTVAVTGRYLVKEIGYLNAGVETELIESKYPMFMSIIGVTQSATSIAITMQLFNESTGELIEDIGTSTMTVTARVGGVSYDATATFASNALTVTITGTGFSTTSNKVKLALSNADYFATEVTFDTANFD